MSDEADRAQPQIEKDLQDAIDRARARPAMAAIGMCHFCDEDLGAGVLFCNIHCRDDFERAEAARRRNGIKQ